MAEARAEIGIIGGSGLYTVEGLEENTAGEARDTVGEPF